MIFNEKSSQSLKSFQTVRDDNRGYMPIEAKQYKSAVAISRRRK